MSLAAEAADVLSSHTVSVTVPVLHWASVSATSSYTARLRTNLVFVFTPLHTLCKHLIIIIIIKNAQWCKMLKDLKQKLKTHVEMARGPARRWVRQNTHVWVPHWTVELLLLLLLLLFNYVLIGLTLPHKCCRGTFHSQSNKCIDGRQCINIKMTVHKAEVDSVGAALMVQEWQKWQQKFK